MRTSWTRDVVLETSADLLEFTSEDPVPPVLRQGFVVPTTSVPITIWLMGRLSHRKVDSQMVDFVNSPHDLLIFNPRNSIKWLVRSRRCPKCHSHLRNKRERRRSERPGSHPNTTSIWMEKQIENPRNFIKHTSNGHMFFRISTPQVLCSVAEEC